MDARTLLAIIYDEDQLNELAENIRRYPNEPIINLLERVFPAAAQPAQPAAANADGAVTGDGVAECSVDLLRDAVIGDSGHGTCVNQRYQENAAQWEALAACGFVRRVDDGSESLWKTYEITEEARRFIAENQGNLTDPYEVSLEPSKYPDDIQRELYGYVERALKQDAELTRQRKRADAAERERDELARKLAAARTKQAEHSEIEDLLMERGELTPGVSLSKQVAGLLSKLETKRDVLEAECDELQAAVNAAVAGVDTLAPLEALTRLLELRRRVSG